MKSGVRRHIDPRSGRFLLPFGLFSLVTICTLIFVKRNNDSDSRNVAVTLASIGEISVEPGLGVRGRLELGMTGKDIMRMNPDATPHRESIGGSRWWGLFDQDSSVYFIVPSLSASAVVTDQDPVSGIRFHVDLRKVNATDDPATSKERLSIPFRGRIGSLTITNAEVTREAVMGTFGKVQITTKEPNEKWRRMVSGALEPFADQQSSDEQALWYPAIGLRFIISSNCVTAFVAFNKLTKEGLPAFKDSFPPR